MMRKRATRNGFERLLQHVSRDLNELTQTDREVYVDSFVAVGRHYGVDVMAEFLHNGKSISAVLRMIEERQKSKLVGRS
jgi:hypothetical protein